MAKDPSNPSGIGAPVLRLEDDKFLRGAGRFVDDLEVPGALHCHVVRSPHAHARIRGIDTRDAQAAPDVVAVFVGGDMAADGVGPMLCMWPVTGVDGRPAAEPPRWALAREVVPHVGEPVVAVIAETAMAAIDAGERVVVDYEPLPAVTASNAALANGAVQLHADAPGNVCFRFERGDAQTVATAIDDAAHVIRLDLTNNRLAGAALEPGTLMAVPEPVGGSLTLYAATQVPHHVRKFVAEQLSMAELHLRVVAPDVGGGFGYKGKHYPEETLIVWAARRLRRPVRWRATRGESFVSDTQARDHLTHAELALGAAIPSAIYSGLLAGVYRTPLIHVSVTGVFTNTVPTDAYRGAGRPEAAFVLERLADEGARVIGIDRNEIRRRNLIPASRCPIRHQSVRPTTPAIFPTCSKKPSPSPNRARHRGERGSYAALGLRFMLNRQAWRRREWRAPAVAALGFSSPPRSVLTARVACWPCLARTTTDRAHSMTFAQILSQRLGVDLDRIAIVEGDTGVVPLGTGTFGSRSIAVGGSALVLAADKIIAKGRRLAAHLLEASENDLEFGAAGYRVTGTDRSLSFDDVATAANNAHDYPDGFEPGLNETAVFDPPNFAYSNGCHACELEIDAETGAIDILGYWVVDDVGTVINPMIVHGQVHGGLAQGIGQALMETCVYDHESGQLLSASFMDHAIPRARDLPFFVAETDESQPCTFNPLGAKGCGESGAIGAPAAVTSAVLDDALARFGVTDIAMPITPERVWQALRSVEIVS